MQVHEKCRIGKFVPLFFAIMIHHRVRFRKGRAPVAGPTVSLPALELEAFGALPSSRPAAVTPALQEQAVTLDRTLNHEQVMAFLGVRLTPGQEKFLNEHRFLLIPKGATRFKGQGGPWGRGRFVMTRCSGCLTS